jgi:hypothetical protein
MADFPLAPPGTSCGICHDVEGVLTFELESSDKSRRVGNVCNRCFNLDDALTAYIFTLVSN